jgi:DNA mismatch endonuclease (patch repair protein)
VFVDGCFCHCHPRHSNIPKGNRPFWETKLSANQARDKRVNRTLRKMGWRVLRIWEHELREPAKVIARIRAKIREPE